MDYYKLRQVLVDRHLFYPTSKLIILNNEILYIDCEDKLFIGKKNREWSFRFKRILIPLIRANNLYIDFSNEELNPKLQSLLLKCNYIQVAKNVFKGIKWVEQ